MRLLLVALAALALPAGAAAATVRVHGHAMYYVCRGSGSPTVVLDAGSPDSSAAWRAVRAPGVAVAAIRGVVAAMRAFAGLPARCLRR